MRVELTNQSVSIFVEGTLQDFVLCEQTEPPQIEIELVAPGVGPIRVILSDTDLATIIRRTRLSTVPKIRESVA